MDSGNAEAICEAVEKQDAQKKERAKQQKQMKPTHCQAKAYIQWKEADVETWQHNLRMEQDAPTPKNNADYYAWARTHTHMLKIAERGFDPRTFGL